MVEFHLRGRLLNFEKPQHMFTVFIPLSRELFDKYTFGAKKSTSIRKAFNVKEDFEDVDILAEESREGEYQLRVKVFLTPGSYPSVTEVIKQLSHSLYRSTGMVLTLELVRKKRYLKLIFSEKSSNLFAHFYNEKFSVRSTSSFFNSFLKHPVDTVLSERSYLLFDYNSLLHEIKSEEDINIPFPSDHEILVYSNICDFTHFGSKQIQILRACKFQLKNHNYNQVLIFDTPHYIPVSNNRIRVVDIELRDLTGDYFPLKDGHAILKLHFRKVNKD